MMPAPPVTLHCVAGTTFEASFALTEDGSPVDLTGATARFEIAPVQSAGVAWTGAPHITISTPATGVIAIALPPAETRLFRSRNLQWEWMLKVTFSDGIVLPVAAGPLIVQPELVPA